MENEEWGWGDEWVAAPWDGQDEGEDGWNEEREWGRVGWLEDLLVPLDTIPAVG